MIKMIKYNIVMCCCDKILVNVAAYVIPGKVCVCVVQSKQEPTFGVYCNIFKVFIAFVPTVVATFRVDVRWKWAFVQMLQW